MVSNIVRFDKIRVRAIANITGSYTPFGFSTTPTTPAPFTHAMRVLQFVNDTDGSLMISFDGINDNVFLGPNTFALYDLTSDQDQNESFRYQNGTQLYVKYVIAPSASTSTDTVYLIAIYGLGE